MTSISLTDALPERLIDEGHEPAGGEYLAQMQALLAPAGEWRADLKARGIPWRTAQDRILKAQGRFTSYRAVAAATETATAGLLEPESEAEPVSAGAVSEAVPDATLATPATPSADTTGKKVSRKPPQRKPVEDEADDETVRLPLADYQLYRKMRRYFTTLLWPWRRNPPVDHDAINEGLDRLHAYIDDNEDDDRLYACERLTYEDLARLRYEAAIGRAPYASTLSAEERATLPPPTPAQAVAIRGVYASLDKDEATDVR